MEDKNYINTKPVLTIGEAAEYTGFSVGYLHQLTAAKKIPFSKPNGKAIFFDRKELEQWMLQGSYPLEEQFVEVPYDWWVILSQAKKEDILQVALGVLDYAYLGSCPILKNDSARGLFRRLQGSYMDLLSHRNSKYPMDTRPVKVNLCKLFLDCDVEKAWDARKKNNEEAEDLSF